MLSERLISLRKSKKKTQEEIANVIGVTRPAYTAYERGTRTPDYDVLKTLADYYEVSIDYLLGHKNDINNMDEEKIDEELQEFIDNVKVWYKNEPKTSEEKLKLMKEMFDIIKKY